MPSSSFWSSNCSTQIISFSYISEVKHKKFLLLHFCLWALEARDFCLQFLSCPAVSLGAGPIPGKTKILGKGSRISATAAHILGISRLHIATEQICFDLCTVWHYWNVKKKVVCGGGFIHKAERMEVRSPKPQNHEDKGWGCLWIKEASYMSWGGPGKSGWSWSACLSS